MWRKIRLATIGLLFGGGKKEEGFAGESSVPISQEEIGWSPAPHYRRRWGANYRLRLGREAALKPAALGGC